MKKYFVSYAYFAQGNAGYGAVNMSLENGVFSIDDIDGIRKWIIADIERGLGIKDVEVAILNWRRYDFSLVLWIKDIFNKIRGIA